MAEEAPPCSGELASSVVVSTAVPTIDYSMHAENRARVVANLRSFGEGTVPPSAVILMQGGKAETRHDSDNEPLFRQVSELAPQMAKAPSRPRWQRNPPQWRWYHAERSPRRGPSSPLGGADAACRLRRATSTTSSARASPTATAPSTWRPARPRSSSRACPRSTRRGWGTFSPQATSRSCTAWRVCASPTNSTRC